MNIANQEVLLGVQLEKLCLLGDIRKTKMCYFGNIIRHSICQHPLLEGKIEDRPRTMWIGNITAWSGLGYVETTRKAHDRNN